MKHIANKISDQISTDTFLNEQDKWLTNKKMEEKTEKVRRVDSKTANLVSHALPNNSIQYSIDMRDGTNKKLKDETAVKLRVFQ